ncbi:MAG: sulfotransferase domain-containing protein, partial [Pseudomonadota bacterium]
MALLVYPGGRCRNSGTLENLVLPNSISLSTYTIFRRRLKKIARWREFEKFLKRTRLPRKADIVVVSHPKCGRTWLNAMISNVYHQRYGISARELIAFDNFHRVDSRVPRILFTHDDRQDGTHRSFLTPRVLAARKTILLVRDPRDAAISAYFHLHGRKPERRRGPEVAMPIANYVLEHKLPLILDFLGRWRDLIEGLEHSMIVRYEDLRTCPEHELARVIAFIEGQAEPDEIAKAVQFASFDNLKILEASKFFKSDKLHPGDRQTPQSFMVRRGAVGASQEYFNKAQYERIETKV